VTHGHKSREKKKIEGQIFQVNFKVKIKEKMITFTGGTEHNPTPQGTQ